MTAFYSSKAMPKQVFGEGELLEVFYEALQTLAPAAWELNEAFMSIWDPEALSNDWVLPDNFHVKVKVMSQVKEVVHFLNEPFEISYNINAPQAEGRSLGANTTHSIDGLIVREISRRCDYDAKKVEWLRDLLTSIADEPSVFHQRHLTDDDKLVAILWNRYQESGYLSARILDHLNTDNLGHVDTSVISALLSSLPEKPFKVISVH